MHPCTASGVLLCCALGRPLIVRLEDSPVGAMVLEWRWQRWVLLCMLLVMCQLVQLELPPLACEWERRWSAGGCVCVLLAGVVCSIAECCLQCHPKLFVVSDLVLKM